MNLQAIGGEFTPALTCGDVNKKLRTVALQRTRAKATTYPFSGIQPMVGVERICPEDFEL